MASEILRSSILKAMHGGSNYLGKDDYVAIDHLFLEKKENCLDYFVGPCKNRVSALLSLSQSFLAPFLLSPRTLSDD